MKLSPNFSLSEFTDTETGIDNTPTEDQIKELTKLAGSLEVVREAVGNRRITVTSGFRTKEVNNAVGGSTNPPSAHTLCYAADIQVKGLSVKQVCDLIDLAGIHYDQMIEEYHKGTTWVHISFDPRLRKQRLIYKNGKYTKAA